MSNQVQLLVEWTISTGKHDAFRKLAQAAIDSVKANEPEAIGYEWYFNKDESKCYLTGSYTDSQCMLVHLKNIGPDLPMFFGVSAITRIEVFGNLTEEAERALAPLRAQTFSHWNGITR